MSRSEKFEVLAIVLLNSLVAVVNKRLPARVELADVVLGAAALLLIQGLVRDLFRLRAARKAAAVQAAPVVTCMCAESTIGATAIIAGIIMVLALSPIVLHVPTVAWPIGFAAVTVFGFATRSLVLDWREKRFRWQPDHNVSVAWKK